MKLNAVEKFLVNNPVRAFAQNKIEAGMLEKFGGKTAGGRVLEIGCSRGVGTEIILKRFGAAEVHAFDLDPLMIELAEKRLASFPAKSCASTSATRRRSTRPMSFTTRFSISASFITSRAGRTRSEKRRGC